MTETKFAVGDRVRCIMPAFSALSSEEQKTAWLLDTGAAYTVSALIDGDNGAAVHLEEWFDYQYPAAWFSKANVDELSDFAPPVEKTYTEDEVSAMVAAAYEAAAVDVAEWGKLYDRMGYDNEEVSGQVAHDIRTLTPTDARAALDRLIAEAVKEERRRIYKMLCAMGDAEFEVNNSHDGQLLYHVASKVAALKGGEV